MELFAMARAATNDSDHTASAWAMNCRSEGASEVWKFGLFSGMRPA